LKSLCEKCLNKKCLKTGKMCRELHNLLLRSGVKGKHFIRPSKEKPFTNLNRDDYKYLKKTGQIRKVL
jgi:hypothetical protein